jgi:N-acetylglucosamine-6-sulfatase
MSRSRRRAVLVLACLVSGLLGAVPVAGAKEQAPDIVVIVTDDQRFDTLWAMPLVQRELVAKGVTFAEAFVVNPICCPSRASILTGDYSHTTGVYRQTPPFGRFDWFRDGSTLPTWLDDAGYTTGLFGKYLDGYQHAALTGYVPPGWDRWVAFVHAAYYEYKLTVDGTIRAHGSSSEEYSTDVLAEEATDFILDSDGPLFLYFSPAAPHWPATAASSDEEAFADLAPWRPPAFGEADVTDKPPWVRALPPLTPERRAEIDALRRDQYRSLLAVDRAVASIVSALEEAGRLGNSLIVYTSDNGLAWGEHRWTKKEAPYEEVIRVPLVVRWDGGGLQPGTTSGAFALNLDIAPTIVHATGIAAPEMEGRSLLPVLRGRVPADWRNDFLVEHLAGRNPVPTYCAVRSAGWMYVRYADGEQELYDLSSDPTQLNNLASSAEASGDLRGLRRRLEALCRPAPPGYAQDGRSVRVLLGVVALFGAFVASALRSRRSVT